MTYLTMLFEGLLCVFSNTLEIIEDVYLFAESHFDRQRDFEKVDDFINLAVVCSFKLLCSALFVASLTLWTWYNLPLKCSSRKDLEAERDDALNTIQQLVVRISELEAMAERTLADRNATRHDYGLLSTEKTVLENKLARLQSQPDLQAKCWDLESSLERSQAQCLDLEQSLERSKRLRRDEDSERKALSKQAKRARSELIEVKTSLRLELECLKVDHYENLAMVKKERDQAKAALPARLVQLQKENKVRNDEVTLLKEIREAQKTNFEAQLAKQSLQIKRLEDDLKGERRDFEDLEKMYEELAASQQRKEAHGAEPETVMDGELQNEIRELRISLNSKAEAINSYQSQIAELEEEIKAKEAFQKDTGLTSLQNTRDQASPDLQVEASAANKPRILEPERLLNAEDTGHDDLESIEWKRLSEQRQQLAETITRLEEMIDNRDQRRAATETYRTQHVEAQKAVKAGEGGGAGRASEDRRRAGWKDCGDGRSGNGGGRKWKLRLEEKAARRRAGRPASQNRPAWVEERGRRTELGIRWGFDFSIFFSIFQFPFFISYYCCIDFCDILEFGASDTFLFRECDDGFYHSIYLLSSEADRWSG